MTYWRATVERPDGDGGWTVVAVFGTPDTPGERGGSARHLLGGTPVDAAQLLLGQVWPVNLAEFNERNDPGMWADWKKAKTGIADHRITVDVDESHRWSVPYGQPIPEPRTFTVAELRLADVRAQAADLATAQDKLKALTEQIRQARADVRHGRWSVEQAKEEATRAGVTPADVAKASRRPRQPRSSPTMPPAGGRA